MSTDYDLFMTKEEQDGTYTYTDYLANFKFNRFVSFYN